MEKTLSALVVHDIKNALALLEIDLEQLIHREDAPTEGIRAYRRCVDLKSRLISFLTLYKYDQSGLQPLTQEVVLLEFIEDLVRHSQSGMAPESHHGHKITVSIDYEKMQMGRMATAWLDENLVELAMESALNNAIRYAHHRVDVWVEQTPDALILNVQDDGVGVGVVGALMQRNIPDQSSSTGLGLALCKAVAEAHGRGEVRLESISGGGTLFSMTLRSAS
ncbi:MAG TPA: sensor histidine kinase [Gallionella sp.]|jgi:signal transduction histidine kinase|nr:HAMP domain-containing sensor histidine kinase [Gallionella sp.]OGS67426.1 MAG: histidine kinase [Gallionellales bacterium GWA2_54_124]OGT17508.1 MAG: histidine kinase [Gallionellales bacterium RIFOXYD12_FULL_53_10]HCI52247.1 sensor histidine kinase [Gallionella sp.]